MTEKTDKNILLVEDQAIIAADEKMALEKYGYHVTVVHTGEKAIAAFKSGIPINLLLMDVDLGEGIDGVECAEMILKTNDVPIVFLSSHAEPEFVDKTEKITSYGYILKNASSTVLDASIKMAFKLFEAKRIIKESELKQSAMIANIPDIIAIYDTEGTVKFISPNITKLFGWSVGEIIGSSALTRIHPLDRDSVLRDLHSILEQDNKTLTSEYRIQNKSGSYYPIEVTGTNMIHDPIISGILVNYHDISYRKQSEQRELIIKEAHHRLKNNMNTINSILLLQAETLDDPSAINALRDAASRVQSMMLLYDKLYQSIAGTSISLKSYLPALVDEIIANFPNSSTVRLIKNIDDFTINIKKMQPLGIIINEILTNTMKHAFKGKSEGVIEVSASLKGSQVSLIIRDNGNGLPDGIRLEDQNDPGLPAHGFGLTLVTKLVQQIDGVVRIDRNNGTRFTIEFER